LSQALDHHFQRFYYRASRQPLRSQDIREQIKITLSEDPVEILFMTRIKNITQQKTNKSIGSTLATFCNVEDDKLYKFCCLNWKHLILEN
jgi:hypothetical protein